MKPISSRAALRRLFIIVAFAIGVVIFSYGWSVTQINLDRPQEPIRQQNAGNALRELLSPRIFDQDYDIQAATTSFLVTCPADGSAPAFEDAVASEESPYIVVTPACADSNDLVTVQGFNFYPDSLARMNWITTDGERRIRQVVGSNQNNFVTNDDGTFTVQIEVPRIRGSAGETHIVEAQGSFPSGAPRFSATTSLVLEKMVETVFLALIATTLSILPSAVLSFFAAHNLMRPVHITLGNLLVGFALLPVGWFLGTRFLNPIGISALNLGSGEGILGSASIGILLLFATAISSRLQPSNSDPSRKLLKGFLNKILMSVAFLFILGLLGGLGVWFGSQFNAGIPGYLSNFVGSVGTLINLLMPLVAGITGAFVLSSIGTSFATEALRQMDVGVTRIIAIPLGAAAGAVLLGVIAAIGMQAAWLGLLTPFIAALMAGGILPMLYDHFVSRGRKSKSGNIRQALWWIGAVAGFILTFSELSVGRTLIEGTLPALNPAIEFWGITIYTYMAKAMVIGAVLGGAASFMAGLQSAFPIGEMLYNTTRTILNALRSIEPLIMGLVFVIWVGIGPFAGVLALTLHSIASLGKLYSEQIENIDSGPIEALQSTGANRLQTIMYAVVPQIVPPYIAFTMYRWDINVRMSTIIGFVGGGGVGFLLQQQINLLRYRDAGVAVLAIAIVVSVLDFASASIRERVI